MEPTLSKFGLTAHDAERLGPILERTAARGPARWTVILLCCALSMVILVGFGLDWMSAAWLAFLGGSLVAKVVERPLFDRIVPGMRAYRAYKNAVLAQERQLELQRIAYWHGLTGSAFEREVADLFRRLGHRVNLKGGPSDGGVDIEIDHDTIVQCKAHSTPEGPAVVRELLGAKTHFRAARAILICTGGFTAGAKRFARTSGIELLDVHALIEMQRRQVERVSGLGDR